MRVGPTARTVLIQVRMRENGSTPVISPARATKTRDDSPPRSRRPIISPAENDGHAVRRIAFPRDQVAIGEVLLLGVPGEPADLRLRQVRQQRNPPQRLKQRLFVRPCDLFRSLVHGDPRVDDFLSLLSNRRPGR